MASSNHAVISAVRSSLGGQLPAQCPTGFQVTDFAVTYTNGELMADVQVTAVPAGLTLVGVTVAAAPDATSSSTYCMAVAANNAGLPLPLSLLAASTSPAIAGQTTVTGMVILSYMRGSAEEQCTISREFTIGV